MNRYLLLEVAGIWMTVTAAATLIAVAGSESPSQHGLQFVWLVLLGSPWCMFVLIAEPGSVWVYPELVAYSVINLCLLLLVAHLVASVERRCGVDTGGIFGTERATKSETVTTRGRSQCQTMTPRVASQAAT